MNWNGFTRSWFSFQIFLLHESIDWTRQSASALWTNSISNVKVPIWAQGLISFIGLRGWWNPGQILWARGREVHRPTACFEWTRTASWGLVGQTLGLIWYYLKYWLISWPLQRSRSRPSICTSFEVLFSVMTAWSGPNSGELDPSLRGVFDQHFRWGACITISSV